MKVLIVGSGDIGTAVGLQLGEQGHQVSALRRSLPTSKNKLFYIQADISDSKSLDTLEIDYDFVIFIASVDRRTEEAYRNLYEIGLNNILKHFTGESSNSTFIFVSSTAVYGQSNGEYVDEETSPIVNNFRSKILLDAENSVLSHNELSIILRFSGIYGRGDTYMIDKIKNSKPIQHTPIYYTNRIHRDDCIGVICFLVEIQSFNKLEYRVFNVTQNQGIPLYEYASIIAEKNELSKPLKEVIDSTEVEQGKRIRGLRIRDLGYLFKHNNF